MGQVDIENLFRIYYEVNSIIKKHKLSFSFKIDHGTYETAIEFTNKGVFHPPVSKNWDNTSDIFCPDLLDWYHKIIIEYEEEVGPQREGSHFAKKGHHRRGDLENKHDTKRNKYYNDGGFFLLRIWESDEQWQKKLEIFLLRLKRNVFKNNNYCM